MSSLFYRSGESSFAKKVFDEVQNGKSVYYKGRKLSSR